MQEGHKEGNTMHCQGFAHLNNDEECFASCKDLLVSAVA